MSTILQVEAVSHSSGADKTGKSVRDAKNKKKKAPERDASTSEQRVAMTSGGIRISAETCRGGKVAAAAGLPSKRKPAKQIRLKLSLSFFMNTNGYVFVLRNFPPFVFFPNWKDPDKNTGWQQTVAHVRHPVPWNNAASQTFNEVREGKYGS